MSERSIRVNELILRELSHILRTRFREQTVAITLTEVSVSPDLRAGRVYYSVIGDERAKIKARSFFTKEYRSLRQLVAQKIVLKYFPKLNFVEDNSIARGNRVLDLLGELDAQDAFAPNRLEHDEADFDDSDAEDAGVDYAAGSDYAADSDADAAVSDAGANADSAAAPQYVFDADDLEYARDIAADADALDTLDGDEFEAFDEESDVEFDGDLDADDDAFDPEDDNDDDLEGDDLDDDLGDEDLLDDDDDLDEDGGHGKN